MNNKKNNKLKINNNINKIKIILGMSKINNKYPLLKLPFIFAIIFTVILNILGISFIEFITNKYYVKMYFVISNSIIIFYNLLKLYILHKFVSATNKVNIPELLPDFIIKWLQTFEREASNKELVKAYKKLFYMQISIYCVTLVIAILIL